MLQQRVHHVFRSVYNKYGGYGGIRFHHHFYATNHRRDGGGYVGDGDNGGIKFHHRSYATNRRSNRRRGGGSGKSGNPMKLYGDDDIMYGTNRQQMERLNVHKAKVKEQEQDAVKSVKKKKYDAETSQVKLPSTPFSLYQGNPTAGVAEELKRSGVTFQTVHNILAKLEATPRKSAKLNSAYARVFVNYCKAPVYSLQLLEEIFNSFVQRGNPTRTHITMMMNAYLRNRKVEEAWSMWRHMKKRGIRPDTVAYNTMLKLLGTVAGDFDTSMKLFEEMKSNTSELARPDAVTYSTIIDTVGQLTLDKELALSLLREALQNVTKGSHYIVYSTALTVMSHAGDVAGAEKLFDEMAERRMEVDEVAFRVLAMAHARAGDVDGTYDVLDRMGKVGIRPSRPFFVALMGAYARVGDADGAIRTYQEMKLEHGLAPNEFTAHALLDAVGFCGSLDVQSTVFSRMCEEGFVDPLEKGVLDVRKYTIHGVKVPLNYYFSKLERDYRMGEESIPPKGLHVVVGSGVPTRRDYATHSWPRNTVTTTVAVQWLKNFKPRLKFTPTSNPGIMVIPRVALLDAFRSRKAFVNITEDAQMMARQSLRRHQRKQTVSEVHALSAGPTATNNSDTGGK